MTASEFTAGIEDHATDPAERHPPSVQGGARPAVRHRPQSAPVPRDPATRAHEAEDRFLRRLDEDLDPREAGEATAEAGKEIARLLGMQLVRAIVTRSGMTLAELSERSGIAAETISRLSVGKRATGPALWTLLALAEAANVPLTVAIESAGA